MLRSLFLKSPLPSHSKYRRRSPIWTPRVGAGKPLLNWARRVASGFGRESAPIPTGITVSLKIAMIVRQFESRATRCVSTSSSSLLSCIVLTSLYKKDEMGQHHRTSIYCDCEQQQQLQKQVSRKPTTLRETIQA